MSLTFTDIFCGAGGSSIGLANAGLELRLAANHWDRAVETHSTNFPDAAHLVADVSNYDMRRLPHTDVLWASPECTWHSPAGGRKQAKRIRAQLDMFDEHVPNAAAVRSRATAFDVIRAAEVHRYKVIIVANVCEFADWEMFDWWLAGLRNTLGYTVQLISVSSAHIGDAHNSPAPQWRDRLYVLATAKGVPVPDVRPRPAAWCPNCDAMVAAVQSWRNPARRQVGKYRQQYDYRCPNQTCRYNVLEPYVLPAATAIDWADLGSRIGDRAKPLAAATIRRIQAGLAMFAQPAMIAVNHHGDGRAYPAADLPLAARTTKIGDGIAWPPFMVYGYSGGIERRVKPIHDPLGTLVANGRGHHGLCIPPMLVPAGGTWNETATPLDGPMRTRTTRDAEAVVVPDAFLTMLRKHATATATDPLATLTTSGGGAGHHALTIPPGAFIQKHHGGLDYGPIQHMTKGVGEPLPGVVARPNLSLVIPYRRGKAKTTDEPLLTLGTRDSAALVDPTGMAVEDCHFRMLRPREHARGQRFPDSYRITGNQGEQTMQAGNAVSSNVSQWLGAITVTVLS